MTRVLVTSLCPRSCESDPAWSDAEQQVQKPTCDYCGGDGWYVGHEDECYEDGDCNCSGVQIECDACGGTGRPWRV